MSLEYDSNSQLDRTSSRDSPREGGLIDSGLDIWYLITVILYVSSWAFGLACDL
jgi:hypothetical protein